MDAPSRMGFPIDFDRVSGRRKNKRASPVQAHSLTDAQLTKVRQLEGISWLTILPTRKQGISTRVRRRVLAERFSVYVSGTGDACCELRFSRMQLIDGRDSKHFKLGVLPTAEGRTSPNHWSRLMGTFDFLQPGRGERGMLAPGACWHSPRHSGTTDPRKLWLGSDVTSRALNPPINEWSDSIIQVEFPCQKCVFRGQK